MTTTAKTGRMTTAIERIFVALKHPSSSFLYILNFPEDKQMKTQTLRRTRLACTYFSLFIKIIHTCFILNSKTITEFGCQC